MAAEYELKLANVMPAGDHVALACDKLAELVKAKTNGKMIIKTFHGGQLGSGKETFEAVKTGFFGRRGGLLCQHVHPDPGFLSPSTFPTSSSPAISSWPRSRTRRSAAVWTPP